jgi:hypothetical protein
MAAEAVLRLISGEHEVQRLAPMLGIDKTPLCTLPEATAAFASEVEYAEELTAAALGFAEDYLFMRAGVDEDGLTQHEIGSLHLFTLEGLYLKLSERCRDKDRKALVKFWFPYIKLLLTGLSKLPNVVHC